MSIQEKKKKLQNLIIVNVGSVIPENVSLHHTLENAFDMESSCFKRSLELRHYMNYLTIF